MPTTFEQLDILRRLRAHLFAQRRPPGVFASPLDRPMPTTERGSTLSVALAAAVNGQVIELEEGTYTGAFTLSNKANITIRPRAGAHAVITNRDTRFLSPNSLWTPQATPGLYRINEVIGQTVHRITGERIFVTNETARFDFFLADDLDAVFIAADHSLIYLRGDNPNATPLWITPNNNALLDMTNCDGLVLRGLDFRFGGSQDVDLQTCDDVLIEECTFFGGKLGIRCFNADSPRLTVRRNWLVNYNNPEWYYRDIKNNSLMEGSAIGAPGDSPIVEENIIEGWHNGIEMTTGAVLNVDPIIRYNYLRDIQDDAIEVDGPGPTRGGEIYENMVLDAFIGFSLSPRVPETPGVDIIHIHHNAMQITKLNTLFDRTGATTGVCSGTKFNMAAAVDALFENNTFVGDARLVNGSVTAGGPYPENVKFYNNIFYSRVGPLVRMPGLASNDNDYNGNVYFTIEAVSGAIIAWNQDTSPPTSFAISYADLAAAKASAQGVAAGWEANGIQLDPLFVIPGEPSSSGSLLLVLLGKGAFAGGAAATRIDSFTILANGWGLLVGDGFASINHPYIKVVSKTHAIVAPL